MKLSNRYTSIIIASHIPNADRATMFSACLRTLIETTKDSPVEIIIVDNGGNLLISNFLDGLLNNREIQCLIRNSENMHFGFARNQGIAMAKGKYIVIADNDIHFNPGWLEACWEPLEEYPARKIYSTPLEYPTGFLKEKYDQGKLDVHGVEYNLNMRAGSNCFMIRRRDLEKIGLFLNHRIAGTKWTDKACGMKYLAAVAPGGYVYDLGLRAGYSHNIATSIKRTLCDGTEVVFNEDEYEHES